MVFVAHSEKGIEQQWISISTFLAFKMTYCEMFLYIKCNSLRRAVYFDDFLHCILDKISYQFTLLAKEPFQIEFRCIHTKTTVSEQNLLNIFDEYL